MMEGMMTDPQRKLLFSKMQEGNVSKDDLEKSLGFGISELTKGEASTLIDCFINNGDLNEATKIIKENHSTAQPEENREKAKPPEQKTKEKQVAKSEEIYGYRSEEVELIKTNFAYGATDAELKLFFYIAKTRKLNPLLGEIKWVRRRKYDKEKKEWIKTASIIIGIDGARRKAQESGILDGIEVSVEKEGNKILYGLATVWLKGSLHPIKTEVPFDEFAAKDQDGNLIQLWKTMPETMIKKVAEMTAYRMAFPSQLAGMYIDEEMQQAGTSEPAPIEMD